MSSRAPITIPTNWRPSPSPVASTYLNPTSSTTPSTHESPLLTAIRSTLGAERAISSTISSTPFVGEEELCWDMNQVLLITGGVVRKRWDLRNEGQGVRYASLVWFEAPTPLHLDSAIRPEYQSYETQESNSTNTLPGVDDNITPDPGQRPTFGPFASRKPDREKEGKMRQRAVVIFLRSIGKVYYLNGLEYTFYIPFIVRKVWPLKGIGLLLQRVLDVGELEEARAQGEIPLPSVFSMIDPISEMSVVGATEGIRGGYGGKPISLVEEEPSTIMKTIPAQEQILWISPLSLCPADDMVVTLNVETNILSVWRYAYYSNDSKSKSSSPPPSSGKSRASFGRTNPAASSVHGRISSIGSATAATTNPSIPPPSIPLPGHTQRTHSDFRPSLITPNIPPALTATTTMASMMQAQQSQQNQPIKFRGDISDTMDRITLNSNKAGISGGEDDDPGNGGIDTDSIGRMKCIFWVEKLWSGDEPLEAKDVQQSSAITASTFNQGYNGSTDSATLAICLPVSHRILLFSLLHNQETQAILCSPIVDTNFEGKAIAGICATREWRGMCDLLILNVDDDFSSFEDQDMDGGNTGEQAKGNFTLLTFGLHPIQLNVPLPPPPPPTLHSRLFPQPVRPVTLQDPLNTHVSVVFSNKTSHRLSISLFPRTSKLIQETIHLLSYFTSSTFLVSIYIRFLKGWEKRGWIEDGGGGDEGEVWDVFCSSLLGIAGIDSGVGGRENSEGGGLGWSTLHATSSFSRFSEDPSLKKLTFPPRRIPVQSSPPASQKKPHEFSAPILFGLHLLGQCLSVSVTSHKRLVRLVKGLILPIARVIRPEWGEYWLRIIPPSDPSDIWPSTQLTATLSTRLSPWPTDLWVSLYSRILNPEYNTPWQSTGTLAEATFGIPKTELAWAYARRKDDEPLMNLKCLTVVYTCLSSTPRTSQPSQPPLPTENPSSSKDNNDQNGNNPEDSIRTRAEAALLTLLLIFGAFSKTPHIQASRFINGLPPGLAAPIREAMRTCQLSPRGNWPASMYWLIGRNDLAEGVENNPNVIKIGRKWNINEDELGVGGNGTSSGEGGGGVRGYKTLKDYINGSPATRKSISEHAEEVRKAVIGEVGAVTGVELGFDDVIENRFGQDRRVEEVSRMLCSSAIPVIKLVDRPELNEHDQAKEQQHQVMRMAERTLALPLGRALFTFASAHIVTRESYAIPKLEFSVRIQPQSILITPDVTKIPLECISWGEFHNGVAAGLRISPYCTEVESSWIKFNKPTDLSSEHAGFLFALGLTGHLKEMLTWHTFSYLTPKHDLTSIAILLGLAAANLGTSNKQVTKLIAVHTPALLPTPSVDLNVPLITQAAGLAGIGLLYMGTKNRRMAEICLNQISRKDLLQPDLSNEFRESYTITSALAFGMIMLGKGSQIPADEDIFERLAVLIHGAVYEDIDTKFGYAGGGRPPFDTNLTSPAATIALGLMFLKTERQDVADILIIPDTVLTLDRIQPNFLLLRTLAKALIMWDPVTPNEDWLKAQVPDTIKVAMEARFNKTGPVNESYELAYYNIVTGCAFAVALKFAGTASEEAYQLLVKYYDLFYNLSLSTGPAFEQRIRRAAIRDGLNLISISLSMVMAGTGEINTLRRLRFAYGMYSQPVRYGTHVSNHVSLGLLFLGGGRYTLGTSDGAIACMLAAFFPRFPQISSDNKTYLQALRHLWVLAVEPRCLITRDVDTKEVVYLPLKMKVKEEKGGVGTSHFVAPTLIPEIDKLLSIRVDTPRYWPFYLDFSNFPHHKQTLLRSQTLYVKRRTAFLSYLEDPKGSRSLFVRSGSASGDTAMLDCPQLTNIQSQHTSDLYQFISSFSNDTLFLAFADWFCRETGETDEEKILHSYSYAVLLDSILQDKPSTIQTHLTLHRYRRMSPDSQYFNLNLQDLRFFNEFYSKVFDRRFSGKAENNARAPMIRETTLSTILHNYDQQLDAARKTPVFKEVLKQYVVCQGTPAYPANSEHALVSRTLSWYLQRQNVPGSSLLAVLKDLAVAAHTSCLAAEPPQGTQSAALLDEGIREVLHATGTQMTTALGSGWSIRSVRDVIEVWNEVTQQ
ncbi:hypothetical protein C8Q75DRAFT_758459 [Abortiporus biennis]|nr:hypothetical protein C8Q75DRAFT_758459 [Abortiporus biennis]